MFFIACSENKSDIKYTKHVTTNYAKESDRYQIYVEIIDGCEYIICDGLYGLSIIHKANCKNNH